jgi:predicted transcriptional regulator
MSKPRPTKDAWEAARHKWEADPSETFESVSQTLGVSRPAVSKRASAEGWERVQSLHQIIEKAHLQADKVTAKLSEVTGVSAKTTVETAIDIRAQLLDTHRADWTEHRSLFTLDSILEDFDNGKKAKISAEMLTLRQKGERAAYGLDTGDEQASGGSRELSDLERASRLASILDRARRAKAETSND